MKKKKKPSVATKSRSLKRVKKVKVEKETPRDDVLYARIKPENVAYFKQNAAKTGMSLSKYMDKLGDQLRG